MTHKIRVLVAKPGLDGHDKGAKVLVNILRDAGMEVIYTGLHQTPEMVSRAAVQEDVDIVGLSYLSGAHVGLTQEVINALNEAGVEHMKVIVGGNIPERDNDELKAMGVAAIFAGGSSYEEIINTFNEMIAA
ncbi:MAG: methylmalonyl-CoA mutase [Gammaproteobacteria bacterium]|nr:MAG: methylmalonyl-CoA mutase [Gammaproteobacteria bacterium]HDY83128.1 cobalamin B12-binding domain-containing protein [Halieaceae bacterium]